MQIFGHRGGGAGAGENTLPAIRRAFDAGFAGVEVDARRLSDGTLVLSHDPFEPERAGELTLLADCLAVARGRGRVIVEVKNVPWEADFDAPDCVTAQLVADLVTSEDDVIVSSFDFFSAEVARDRGLPAAHLTNVGMRPMAGIAYASENGLQEVHSWIGDVLGEPGCVPQAHDAGLRIIAWTATLPEHLEQLSVLGVDGVITDLVP